MGKIEATKQMIDFRKKAQKKQTENNYEWNDWHGKVQSERFRIKKEKSKLENDRDLAAEAAIGYGLAVKSIEENLRKIEDELLNVESGFEDERPKTYSAVDEFKAEFGFTEYDVDWSSAQSSKTNRRKG